MLITTPQVKEDNINPFMFSLNYADQFLSAQNEFSVNCRKCTADTWDHTGHCVAWRCLAPPPGLITDPQLTAAAGDLNSLWVLAPDPGGLRLITQRHTSNRPIDTHTLVFAIGLKALAVAIDHTIVLTASACQIWTSKKTAKWVKSGWSHPKWIQYQEKHVETYAKMWMYSAQRPLAWFIWVPPP